MLAFRTVQQSNHCAREEFLYELKAALRASPFTPGGMTSDWCHAASSPPRLTGSCPYPGTGVVFALLDRAIKYQRLYRHRSAGLEGAATLRRLRGLRVVRIGSP